MQNACWASLFQTDSERPLTLITAGELYSPAYDKNEGRLPVPITCVLEYFIGNVLKI